MDLVTPGLGLIVWTTIVFLILVFLLGKFAWKPILSAVQAREEAIDQALKQAESARAEMGKLQASNEQLLKQAREEREAIVKEGRAMRDAMVAEAKESASVEAAKILESARTQIHQEKMAAVTELKNQVAQLAVDMAEKVLRAELAQPEVAKANIDRDLKDLNLN
ncbi:MAG: F0F1 ATP synthase subunit B [Schleiferiaceae bacterium]|jgi:F-type H+-transporting ATPase subunit b|nr:F0F1 ATP synthase subunit B [Schleiferiaceae bacterium]